MGALEAGGEVGHFSRSVGIESHGLRAALKPWNPNILDARGYIEECLNRLLEFAVRDDEIGRKAKAAIGNDLRALIGHGFVAFAERAVRRVTEAHGPYWPAALSSLGDVITFDLKDVGGLETNVRALIALFSSLIRRVIDDFGERDDVQSALVANMFTFGWSGSMTTYYELYQQPLAALADHPKAGVRRWARKMSDQIARQIAHEQDSDDEHEAQFQ